MPRLFRRGALALACALFIPLVAVPAQAAGTTVTFSGLVRDYSTRSPLAGACVSVLPWGTAQPVGSACTDAEGYYRMEIACCTSSGDTWYALKATAAGYPEFWWNELAGWNSMRPQAVRSGDRRSASFDLLHQAPRVHGRITDEHGDPALGAVTLMTELHPGGYARAFSYGGQYTIENAPPGRFKIAVTGENLPLQYVPGKTTYEEGTWFEVGDGSDLTVDEQLLPPGGIELVAVDDVTGAPAQLCGALRQLNSGTTITRCTATDGSPAAWTGTFGEYDLVLTPRQRTHWSPEARTVVIEPGRTTRVEIRLKRAYALRTRVAMRADPGLHPRTCVAAVPAEPDGVVLTSSDRGARVAGTFCSDADGRLEIAPLDASRVRLFALPDQLTSLGYPQPAMQWVGVTGGTGDAAKAAVYQLAEGAFIDAPDIRLDHGGTVMGHVSTTAAPTDARICVQPFAPRPNLAVLMEHLGCAGSDGAYWINRIGPYAWPLRIAEREPVESAVTWSGGASSRLLAAPLRILPGKISYYDVTLPLGGLLYGTVAGATGGTVSVHDAYTGDLINAGPLTDGQFNLLGLNSGPVLVRLDTGTGGCWLRLPLDATNQRAVQTRAGAETDVALSVQGCASQPTLYRIPVPRKPGTMTAPTRPQGLGR